MGEALILSNPNNKISINLLNVLLKLISLAIIAHSQEVVKKVYQFNLELNSSKAMGALNFFWNFSEVDTKSK